MQTFHHHLLTRLSLAASLLLLPALANAGSSSTANFDAAMKPVLASYLKIHDALAADTLSGVKTAALAIVTDAKKLDPKGVTGEHAEHYKDLPGKITTAAQHVAAATTLDAARTAFKDLSKPMAMWGTMSKPGGVGVYFCSMAKASWLQKQGDVQNPYFGKDMLGCGEVVGGDATGAHEMKHGEMMHDMQQKK